MINNDFFYSKLIFCSTLYFLICLISQIGCKNLNWFSRDENEIEMDDSVDEQRDCEFCQGSYKSKKILLEHVRGIHKEWILEYV